PEARLCLLNRWRAVVPLIVYAPTRPLRRRVGGPRPVLPRPAPPPGRAVAGPPDDPRRRLPPAADRLPVAGPARPVRPVADGLRPVQPPPQGRHAGRHPVRPATPAERSRPHRPLALLRGRDQRPGVPGGGRGRGGKIRPPASRLTTPSGSPGAGSGPRSTSSPTPTGCPWPWSSRRASGRSAPSSG